MTRVRALTASALPTILSTLAGVASLAAISGFAAGPGRAQAQEPIVVQLGISAGPESMPAALRTSARDPNSQAPGVGAEVRAAVGRVGPFSVEGRAAIHSGEIQGYDVPNLNDIDPTRRFVDERPTVGSGPQAAWDIRLRLDGGREDGPRQSLTLGGGLMTEGVRYLAGSTGRGWGGIGVELEVAAYEVPWRRTELTFSLTDPYVEEALVYEGSNTTYFRRWTLGLGLRVVYWRDILRVRRPM